MSPPIVPRTAAGCRPLHGPFSPRPFRHPTPKVPARLQTPTGPPNDGYTHLQLA